MQRRIGISFGALTPTSRSVVQELLVRGAQPRAELARLLELSPASLTKTTRELLDLGVISPLQALSAESRGRPGVPLEVVGAEHQLIGVKVTGDAVFAVRTTAFGAVLASEHRDLTDTSVEVVLAVIVELVQEMAAGQPVHAVGIGLAGTMDRFDDRVRRNPYLHWDDVPLGSMVERAVGLPTVISGDVRALTAGVQWGAGRAWKDFAVLTIGVGVGLGLVLDGRVLTGARGRAGSIAHHRVSDGGPSCEDGHRGCATGYLTTSAITGAVSSAQGRAVTLPEVYELAASGDPAATRVLDDAGRALGAVIAELTNLLDLEAVVLTGDGLGMLRQGRPALDEALAAGLDSMIADVHVEVFESDFDEWARGAAVVACQWLLLEPPEQQRLRGAPRAS